MEEITFSGIIKSTMLLIAIMFTMLVFIYIVLIALEILTILRWKLNYNILGRGKSPENPIKLSIMYQADFFKVKGKYPKNIIEIAGIELDLGFKECTKSLYVSFPSNIYSSLKPGKMYDFALKPI